MAGWPGKCAPHHALVDKACGRDGYDVDWNVKLVRDQAHQVHDSQPAAVITARLP